ncbi:MAG: sialidase family protein, partial [Candidatus Promineifilaceae bacterium]
ESRNGGVSWDDAVLVDGRQPEDLVEAINPGSIEALFTGESQHRYWLAGHDDSACSVYGQVLQSDGTWTDSAAYFPEIEECVRSFHIQSTPRSGLVALIDDGTSVWLSTYDGNSWSEAVVQPDLLDFQDPDTFLPVQLACLSPVVVETDAVGIDFDLVVVGCDDGDGADIWSRHLPVPDPVEAAEEEPSAWSPISPVYDTSQLSKNPKLVADADGFLHAFWSADPQEGEEPAGLYYSRWDGLNWSQPSRILVSPSGLDADELDVTVDSLGRLAAVWGSQQPSDIYFSESSTSRAALMSEWLTPVSLPVMSPFATEPQLVVDSANNYYVGYAIPVNENRGIYYVLSTAGGADFSEPVRVFDAVEAGWQAVGQPRIAVGVDGTIHALWTKRTLPPDDQPIGLYYSFSVDEGLSWSEPSEIATQPILASELVALGDGSVHIIWRDQNGTTWHQYSLDGGFNWTRPLRIEGQGSAGPIDVVVDAAARLHLLSFGEPIGFSVDEGVPVPLLKHWIWSDEEWETGESLPVTEGQVGRGLSGAISPSGAFSVIFGTETAGEDGEPLAQMSYAVQQLDIPLDVPSPPVLATPTPTPLPEATPTPEPTPTSRAVFSPEQDQGGQLPIPGGNDNPITSSLLGIIPAGIVVLVVFFVGMRVLRRERH